MRWHHGAMRKRALVVIDMLNTYDHADAELLIPSIRETSPESCDYWTGPTPRTFR